jgi:lysophospholipase L1-like esterase
MSIWRRRALLWLMAPLLVAQGRYVRATMPRLAEPPGPRVGRDGQGTRLRLLIAGDSAAAGVGVQDQRSALSGQLVAALAPRFDVEWRLIAKTGYTTRALRERLAGEPSQSVDVAVTSLGVNDVVQGTSPRDWLSEQRRLTDLLRRRFSVRRIILTRVPPMGLFRGLPQPLRAFLGARAEELNTRLAEAMPDWPGCELLSMTSALGEDDLALDGFHPGPSTYRRWASLLAARVADQ